MTANIISFTAIVTIAFSVWRCCRSMRVMRNSIDMWRETTEANGCEFSAWVRNSIVTDRQVALDINELRGIIASMAEQARNSFGAAEALSILAVNRFVEQTDWIQLKAQKLFLINYVDDNIHARGILHFLDALQDMLVDGVGIPQETIFGPLDDDENANLSEEMTDEAIDKQSMDKGRTHTIAERFGRAKVEEDQTEAGPV